MRANRYKVGSTDYQKQVLCFSIVLQLCSSGVCAVFPSMPSSGKAGQPECICWVLNSLSVLYTHMCKWSTCQNEANEIYHFLLRNIMGTEGWQYNKRVISELLTFWLNEILATNLQLICQKMPISFHTEQFLVPKNTKKTKHTLVNIKMNN